MSRSDAFPIDVDGVLTTGLFYPAPQAKATLVLAHGAGGRQTHPWMVQMAMALSSRGIDVVTFDFLYTHAGRRMPDRNDVLEATWRAVAGAVRARRETSGARFFIGGKSMGGRIATQVAAAGVAVDGLVLLGYPLHPPGNPKKLRAAHLAGVSAPMLFVQGSRDAFGTPAELRPFVDGLGRGSSLFEVVGGDHSLALPKSNGQTPEMVIGRVADEVARFTGSR